MMARIGDMGTKVSAKLFECPHTASHRGEALAIEARLRTEKPAYIGRWYTGSAKVCRGKPGEFEGLMVYTPKEIIGYEGRCKIDAALSRGNATELKLSCVGEGETSQDFETVEVVNNRLRRTVDVEGKKMTFTYPRCP